MQVAQLLHALVIALGCLGFACDTVNVPPMSDLVGPQK